MKCKHIFDMDLNKLEDNKVYAYYPTRMHERIDERHFAYGGFLKQYVSEIIEHNKKHLQDIMWGKSKQDD